MRGGVLVDPVFLFIGHAVATGNLLGGTGLVAGTGQRSVTEGFRPVAPSVGVPLVNDHFHRHGTAPDTARSYLINNNTSLGALKLLISG